MFIKQLKYDFMFSAKTFIAMFAGILALTFFVSIADFLPNDMLEIMRILIVGVGGAAVAIASYLQILIFYQRSFFGPEGYLMLTLPVSRGKLLASKFITTFVWFLFMLILIPIMVFIIEPPTVQTVWEVIREIVTGQFVAGLITNMLLPAFVLIALLFFTITLANSVVFGKKVHGVVAGIVSAALHFFYIFGLARLSQRSFATERIYGSHDGFEWSFYADVPLVGIEYGRIAIGEGIREFVDIFSIAYTVGVAILVIATTMHLLKKRIALR